MAAQNKKILTSKQEIMDYIGCSHHSFRKYVENGLPARYEEGRWMAHSDNIDDFFRSYTRICMKNVIKTIPDEDIETPVKLNSTSKPPQSPLKGTSKP